MSGGELLQVILLLASAVFAIMLIIGWHTRTATIASWILQISIQNRNPMLLNSGDVALRLVLMWAIFLPWGEWFSVDSRSKTFKRIRYLSVASFTYISQLAMLYLFSVVFKSGPHWTQDFTALYYALSLDQFTTRLGYVVYQFPELMRLLTHWVLTFEVLGPILLFVPFFKGAIRTVAVLGLIIMHLSFALFMEIGLFPFIMAAFATGILGSFFWDSLLPDTRKLLRPLTRSIGVGDSIRRRVVTPLIKSLQNLPPGNPIVFPKRFRTVSLMIVDITAGFLLMYILIWNIGTLPGRNNYVGNSNLWIAEFLRIDQKWNMFSPYPLTEDGWFIVEVDGKDGIKYDIQFDKNEPVNYAKPELVSAMYPSQRWRKYMMNLFENNHTVHRTYYLQYKCKVWKQNPQYKKGEMRLIYMQESTLLNYRTKPAFKNELAKINC